ncbi:hypothetical protein INR49_025122 [Caranx melampygus]|nr:hypothetical protein INR49_025122 [Caranx melampygus]
MPQDSPDTTLWQGDTTALSSQTAVHTDSTYTSTTISRAGERTLLSVTSSSNSTSSAFTEESNSHQPPSTWGVPASAPGTEDYTHSAPSTRTDSRETTDQHMTHSFKGMFPETGSPGGSRGTQSLTGPPNGTQHQHTSESEETSDSTPPLRVTELSTDQSEVTVSSTPPVTSAAGGPTNISGTDVETDSNVGTSTESSTAGHSSSTQKQKGTEGLSTQTRGESTAIGLTTAPPTVSSNTSEMDKPLTDTPVLVTELFLTTTPVPVTDRSQITEEDTFKASASTITTTPPPPITSSPSFSSTTSSFTSELDTEATVPYTAPPTTVSTPALQTSAARPTHRASSDRTQGPSTHIATPTKVTTMQIETTSTLGIDTSRSHFVTTTYTPSTPTRSTEMLRTTGKQTERGTTELVLTTSPTDTQPTLAPPHMDECDRDPCPLGSTPDDPVILKSATVHEIQREIIQLLNASLEENGFHIFAVNMFSISTNVTSQEVYNSIQMFLRNCNSSVAHCRMALHYQLTYHVESLCVAQKTQCDTERSTCTDSNGTAYCQCLQGYYKHNPDDLSCLECGDGYKLENGTCVPKDKNDINKIIFKSGDLQMSPYADFPKNNRISMEWGRETIEMQENGSTKNLLQMTDIYYSPALRNSDLERNGLYPFTGLPGSRHSCIYPAQWNPSFINYTSVRATGTKIQCSQV